MILLVLVGSICGDLKVLQIYMSRVLTRITQMSNCIKNKTDNKNFIWGRFVSRKSIGIIQKQFSIRGFGTQRVQKKNLPKPYHPFLIPYQTPGSVSSLYANLLGQKCQIDQICPQVTCKTKETLSATRRVAQIITNYSGYTGSMWQLQSVLLLQQIRKSQIPFEGRRDSSGLSF